MCHQVHFRCTTLTVCTRNHFSFFHLPSDTESDTSFVRSDEQPQSCCEEFNRPRCRLVVQGTGRHISSGLCSACTISQVRYCSMLQNLDTALHVAADRGDLDTVKILMPLFWEKRFELNDHGQTCLHKAVHKGHTKVMRYLISQCGLDPNLKDAVSSWPFSLHVLSAISRAQYISSLFAMQESCRTKIGCARC